MTCPPGPDENQAETPLEAPPLATRPALCDAVPAGGWLGYLDGCFRVMADRDKLHQAVKPRALMERLVTVAPAGGLVVDPFAGSGTRVVAALR